MSQEEEYELEYAGARLLGRDLTKIARPQTGQTVLEIFERETSDKSTYRLVEEMEANRTREAELCEYHLRLLQKFQQGVS